MRSIRWSLLVALCVPVPAGAVSTLQYVTSFTAPPVASPRGIGLLPNGDVIVGNGFLNSPLVRFTSAGAFVSTIGVGTVNALDGLAVDGAGDIYFADYQAAPAIEEWSGAGAPIRSWGGIGAGPGLFQSAAGVAVDGGGNVYVSDLTNDYVQVFTGTGAFVRLFGTAGAGVGQFQSPTGVAVDSQGRIFVGDGTRGKVLRFSPTGAFQIEFSAGVEPEGVAMSPDGNIVVVDASNRVVHKYTPDGTLLSATNGFLSLPYRVACDAAGYIYVTDEGFNSIVKFRDAAVTAVQRTTFGRVLNLYRTP
ncbi:MAG TPA: NHL repeat-containing protein [Candidatus Eisenbacteria bacterium]|nr:NHL repeat-containing protein [Candidatus Eisenbacteria bacterium]